MNFKKYHLILLSVFSGILLSFAWFEWGSGIVLFIAFLPLLFIENYLDENKHKYRTISAFNYSYISFFVWNSLTTWWIYNASLFGAIAAVIINSLFMAIVFWLFHITKRKLGNRFGYFALIVYWLGFEHLHLNWELSWPWLTLGNGFANDIRIIQWYEFTGALGGSFWVLLVNIMLFKIIRYFFKYHTLKSLVVDIVTIILLIALPVIISLRIFNNYKEKSNPYNVVVVQPNIDPYHEKFDGLTPMQQLHKLLSLADSLADDSTDYIVGPETALIKGIWEEDIEKDYSINTIWQFLEKYPRAKFVLGLSSYKLYNEGEPVSATARQIKGSEIFYDAYNTAMQLDSTHVVQLYHKSQLVLGVEKMPYPKVFGVLENFAIDLGGIVGSLGIQEERTTFKASDEPISIAPVVCNESIYGAYITEYIKNGADFIFVITNDGWWKNTPGYKQHFSYSKLRAIETRRSIARSANTGISCFINQKGEIFSPTTWWKPAAIKAQINANDKLTFYTLNGDFIGRIADFFAIITLLYTIVVAIVHKKK